MHSSVTHQRKYPARICGNAASSTRHTRARQVCSDTARVISLGHNNGSARAFRRPLAPPPSRTDRPSPARVSPHFQGHGNKNKAAKTPATPQRQRLASLQPSRPPLTPLQRFLPARGACSTSSPPIAVPGTCPSYPWGFQQQSFSPMIIVNVPCRLFFQALAGAPVPAYCARKLRRPVGVV